MKTKTIEITDWREYRPGDMFRGTSRNYKGNGTTVTVEGPLVGDDSERPQWLYVAGHPGLPYVRYQEPTEITPEGYWEDVKVTREVEIPVAPEEYGIWTTRLGKNYDGIGFGDIIIHSPDGWFRGGNLTLRNRPLPQDVVDYMFASAYPPVALVVDGVKQ